MTPSSQVAPGPPRGPGFDTLRLVAAATVVLLHANGALGTDLLWGGLEFVEPIMIFFVITGMFVFASAEASSRRPGGWRDYGRNRWLRVAPGLLVFTALTPVLIVLAGAAPASTLVSRDLVPWFAGALVFAPNYDPSAWSHIGTGSMNGPLYTIPVEVSFYLLAPALVVVARRWGFWRVVTAMGVLSVAGPLLATLAPPMIGAIVHHLFLERAAYFTIGMVLARVGNRVPLRWWLVAVAALMHVGLRAHQDFGPDDGPLAWLQQHVKPVVSAVPAAYLVLFVGMRFPRAIARTVGRLGDLSFGTYLWHSLVLNLALWWGLGGSGWTTTAVLVASLLAGAASWHLVEKWFLRRKRGGLRTSLERPAAEVAGPAVHPAPVAATATAAPWPSPSPGPSASSGSAPASAPEGAPASLRDAP